MKTTRSGSTSVMVRIEQLEQRLVLSNCSVAPPAVASWSLQCGIINFTSGATGGQFDVEPDADPHFLDIYVGSSMSRINACGVYGIFMNATRETATGKTDLFVDVSLTTVGYAGPGHDSFFATTGSLLVEGSCASTAVLDISGGNKANVIDGNAGVLNFSGTNGSVNLVCCTSGTNSVATPDESDSEVDLHGTTLLSCGGDVIVDATGKMVHADVSALAGSRVLVIESRTDKPKVTLDLSQADWSCVISTR